MAMFQTVTLPLWLLVLIVAFATVTFASHFLFPSVRWFFRRRMERVVAKLNERLERPIQPFKLARRTDTIQRLLYDPSVIEAVAAHAAETGVREDVAFQQAKRYAREIVPAFSASAYFGFAIWFARWLSTRLYHVRLGHYDEAGLAAIDKDATIVFVMNHRSNMDYVLVTYLAAERSALSYAVGEWARIWPLQSLIRAMGAYFIRRKSRNSLYRRVLARYVQLATAAGVAQAVFPEGGLSLNGKVGTPRLGILNYIVSEFDPSNRDVVFVPVGINYDRVIEDRILIEADKAGVRRFRGTILSGSVFTARYIWRRVTGKAQRFGFAAVSFGDPLSLTTFKAKGGKDITAAVGAELMKRIKDVVPVLPVPLMASFLAEAKSPLTRAALVEKTERTLARLARRDVPASVNGGSPDEIVENGLRHLLMRHLVIENEAGLIAADDARDVLTFYRASIAHLMEKGGRAVVSPDPQPPGENVPQMQQ